MEGSSTAPAVATEDGPESWEAVDVEASMRRLLISSRKESKDEPDATAGADSGVLTTKASKSTDDLINSVDQFLREAIQNPRERVSVLRLEQDVEMFIRDPAREMMEFQQLPTSYLRLAAHRVAQHYSLQSMVLMDSDGSGSRIIVQKTSNIKLPTIRLADIPVNLPSEEMGAIKVAIKQRQQKGTGSSTTSGSHPLKSNSLKSVEERKEEYNRARARIFNSSNSSGSSSGKRENDPRNQDSTHRGSSVKKKADGKTLPSSSNSTAITISASELSSSSSRLPGRPSEKESGARPKTNNRVAIFRDHEVDRKDPDYSRTYDRYMQRFDPGFGFNSGPYTIQPLYAPVYNYNTEFPQLGSNHRPPVSTEHQHQYLPHRLPGAWVSPSAPSGIVYGPADGMMPPFSSGHINAHSNPGLYLNSTQYPPQQSGMPPSIHPLDPIHRQSYQGQTDMSFGLARSR